MEEFPQGQKSEESEIIYNCFFENILAQTWSVCEKS